MTIYFKTGRVSLKNFKVFYHPYLEVMEGQKVVNISQTRWNLNTTENTANNIIHFQYYFQIGSHLRTLWELRREELWLNSKNKFIHESSVPLKISQSKKSTHFWFFAIDGRAQWWMDGSFMPKKVNIRTHHYVKYNQATNRKSSNFFFWISATNLSLSLFPLIYVPRCEKCNIVLNTIKSFVHCHFHKL